MRPILFLCIAAALLAGCAGEPVQAPIANAPSEHHPRHYARGGGYYLDDGPGDNPPADLDSIPNAVPRKEALIAACNKPYTTMGKTYYPETQLEPYRETGIASWYGRRYNGHKTSSGEIYDMYAMSAAHPTLAIPSYARVTNLENGRSVIVRVNDRGPFRSDRLIDLSYTAAYKLGLIRGGSGRVEVDSIIPGETDYASSSPPKYESAASIQEASSRNEGLYLQLGAFSEKINAQHFIEAHRGELAGYSPEIVNANGIYKVHVGPYPSRVEAESAAGKIAQLLDITPVVTRQ
jgi:rare lipoprotein A